MGEHSKYVFARCTGMLVIGGALLLETKQMIFDNMIFLVIFTAFIISLVAKLLMNQYIEGYKYSFINGMLIVNIIKLGLLMGYSYFIGQFGFSFFKGVERGKIFLEFSALDLLGIIMIRNLSKYKEKYELKFLDLLGIIFLFIGICELIPIKYDLTVCKGLYLLGLVLIGRIYFRWQDEVGIKILGEKALFGKVYVFFCMIQMISLFFLSCFKNQYCMPVIMTIIIQVSYLFLYVYYICIVEPWRNKLEILTQSEEVLYRQNEVCNLIVDLSHELKTPVNVIRSALDIMALDYKEEPKLLGEVKSVKKDCNQMMNIIQDMIDFQKIKGNYINIQYKTYNLVEVIENVVDIFSMEVPSSSFVFNPQEEEIYQEIDIALMQQCMMLYFRSLIKEDPQAIIYIDMGIVEETKETYLVLRNDKIPLLKEIYFTTNETPTRENIIQGLTLRLVRAILDKHSAKLDYMEAQQGLKIIFPKCETITEEWLGEENLDYLRDQMRARGIIG